MGGGELKICWKSGVYSTREVLNRHPTRIIGAETSLFIFVMDTIAAYPIIEWNSSGAEDLLAYRMDFPACDSERESSDPEQRGTKS